MKAAFGVTFVIPALLGCGGRVADDELLAMGAADSPVPVACPRADGLDRVTAPSVVGQVSSSVWTLSSATAMRVPTVKCGSDKLSKEAYAFVAVEIANPDPRRAISVTVFHTEASGGTALFDTIVWTYPRPPSTPTEVLACTQWSDRCSSDLCRSKDPLLYAAVENVVIPANCSVTVYSAAYDDHTVGSGPFTLNVRLDKVL